MKSIKLTQGKYALVDDADFEWLNQWKWHAQKDDYTFYARRRISYNPDRIISMHRVILGAKKGEICDHINRDGLNNTRSNIRIASSSLNNFNQRIRKDNTSGFKGVSLFKESGKWKAQININGKNKYLGLFNTPEEAFEVYQKAFNIRMIELTSLAI